MSPSYLKLLEMLINAYIATIGIEIGCEQFVLSLSPVPVFAGCVHK